MARTPRSVLVCIRRKGRRRSVSPAFALGPPIDRPCLRDAGLPREHEQPCRGREQYPAYRGRARTQSPGRRSAHESRHPYARHGSLGMSDQQYQSRHRNEPRGRSYSRMSASSHRADLLLSARQLWRQRHATTRGWAMAGGQMCRAHVRRAIPPWILTNPSARSIVQPERHIQVRLCVP